jgi:cell pole-organizing protein PopZ
MSNAQPEPSMEEILASIRRIISEDGEEETAKPAGQAQASPQAPTPPRAGEPHPTEAQPAPAKAEPEPFRTGAQSTTEELEMLKKNVTQTIEDDEEEIMLAESAATAATKAFQSLSQTAQISRGEGRTLEDIVTEMLRPMLKEWLDQNLPAIVEEKVEEEVQRLARRRR